MCTLVSDHATKNSIYHIPLLLKRRPADQKQAALTTQAQVRVVAPDRLESSLF
jgi:hypothetical protein